MYHQITNYANIARTSSLRKMSLFVTPVLLATIGVFYLFVFLAPVILASANNIRFQFQYLDESVSELGMCSAGDAVSAVEEDQLGKSDVRSDSDAGF